MGLVLVCVHAPVRAWVLFFGKRGRQREHERHCAHGNSWLTSHNIQYLRNTCLRTHMQAHIRALTHLCMCMRVYTDIATGEGRNIRASRAEERPAPLTRPGVLGACCMHATCMLACMPHACLHACHMLYASSLNAACMLQSHFAVMDRLYGCRASLNGRLSLRC